MKDLYQYVAENYYKMNKEDLRTIAMEALYHLSDVLSSTKEYKKRNEEIIDYVGLEEEMEES